MPGSLTRAQTRNNTKEEVMEIWNKVKKLFAWMIAMIVFLFLLLVGCSVLQGVLIGIVEVTE